MAKGTKRKAPVASLGPRKAKENPFESLHSKQKFTVIGRKVDGQKNVNKARSQAVDRVRSRKYESRTTYLSPQNAEA